MDPVAACVVVTVDVLCADVSVELMLVGTVDVVGKSVKVLVTVLVLLARYGEVMVERSVCGGSAVVLADVTGVVDVDVLMEFEDVDITSLLLVDDTVRSTNHGRINET